MQEIGKPKTIKRTNQRIILNLLRKFPREVSVAEISKKVKLSKTTILKIINHYLKKGLVVNAGKGDSTGEGGKKPSLYRFNEKGGYVIAFHIFPDELSSVVTDLNVNILRTSSTPIRENEGAEKIISIIYGFYTAHVQKLGIDKGELIGIAIGAHGITDYDRGMVIYSPHFPSWGENFPLKDMIAKSLSFRGPIFIDNQIRFQVFAEKVKGIAKNRKNIIVIEGGIGLVAGVIVKDEIKRGVHFLAGEIGHMTLNPFEEETCACGGRGCFEVMVSVKRILGLAKKKYTEFAHSLLFHEKSPDQVSIEDIFSASNKSDPCAQTIMDDVINWFAIGISNLILTYDPEMIIIQGIFTKGGDYFITGLRKRINEISIVKIRRNVRIEYSGFGRDVGLIGAAAYVVHEYFK